jgi:DNA-binding LacI/PurR family transcriptional regulator
MRLLNSLLAACTHLHKPVPERVQVIGYHRPAAVWIRAPVVGLRQAR